MWAAWALVLGGLFRIAGEIVEVLAGGRSTPSSLLAVAGLTCVALGFAGLWPDVRASHIGRLAIVLAALGALAFTGVALWSVGQGVLPISAVARTPGFVAAASITLAGAIALAAWLMHSPHYPTWIGLVMSASIGLSLLSSFVALPALVQPMIDMVMALTFIQLGLFMRERYTKGIARR